MKSIKINLSATYVVGIACTLVMSLFSGSELYAQQDSQYTQYMYNTQMINPAYAGNRGTLSINALHRWQWVGLDGAPRTLNFSANTPVGERVGLGLAFFNDQIGPSKESNIAADFAYILPVSDKVNLSLGIKGGVNILNVDYSQLVLAETNDPGFSQNVNRVSPIIGVGAYLHGEDRWYLGVSTNNLLETKHVKAKKGNSQGVAVSVAAERAHFYLMGGYVFDVSRSVKLKPAVLGKFVSGAPVSIDLSLNAMFNEKFTLGAAYRFDAAVSALAAFQINQNIMIGYAYDFDTHSLGNYNSGSHEVFLRFELGTKKSKYTINPRFF